MRFARVLMLTALVAACANGHNSIGGEDGPCYQNNTCNGGLTCVNDTCVVVDAGTPIDAKETVIPDAPPDAGVIPDGFVPDAAVPDGGVPDAFIPDAAVDAATVPDAAIDAAVDAAVVPDASVDAAVVPDAATTCDPLAQTGCNATQKCTWVDDGTGANGRNQCVPNGTVALGGACTFTGGTNDYDNCVRGDYCTNGTCEAICDPSGGNPKCDAQHACQVYEGVFGVAGSETGGVCDPSCNPLNDNDFDGSATAHTKPGTACTSDPTIGCYGVPSAKTPTHFSCATPAPGALSLHHRSVITGTAYLNACAPGYEIAFAQDATGSNNVDCYAFCRPGDAYLNNPNTQLPNGSSPHGCNNTDALGAFGAKPTAVNNGTNGEHCMYSWFFELDDAGNYLPSATSNTVGICWDHSKYKYDSDGDGVADKTIEPCTSLPLTSTTGVTAVDWACVSTITGGFGFGGKPHKRPYIEGLPELGGLRNR